MVPRQSHRRSAAAAARAALSPRDQGVILQDCWRSEYLAFIYAYTCVNGRPPAQADMQRYFRVTPPTVHQMVLTLERAGLIRRQPGLARSIEVLVAPEYLPVLR
jgi:LexA DNA binding domain